jgi:hypothetical protein
METLFLMQILSHAAPTSIRHEHLSIGQRNAVKHTCKPGKIFRPSRVNAVHESVVVQIHLFRKVGSGKAGKPDWGHEFALQRCPAVR